MSEATRAAQLPRRRLAYGDGEAQFVDLVGSTAGDAVVAVFVHGGFWRSEVDSESLMPAVTATAPALGAAATLEYRTSDRDGGWPHCLDDVVAGVRRLWRMPGAAPERTVLVGHSAGGHLALMAARRLPGLRSVVALAPVTDLPRAHAERLGDGAAQDLFGSSQPPAEALREASPVHGDAPRCRTYVVHGTADQAVPLEYSLRLVAAWRGRADVVLRVVSGARHMHLVRPWRPAWDVVAGCIAEASGRPEASTRFATIAGAE